MENETKEVNEVEVINENKVEVKEENQRSQNETVALTAFVLCCVATVTMSFGLVGAVASIVLSAVAMNFKTKIKEDDLRQPYLTFFKIVKIASIILLVLAIITTTGRFIQDANKVFRFVNELLNHQNSSSSI